MGTRIPLVMSVAAWLAVGCGSSQLPNRDDAGQGGSGGAGATMDGAVDQASCVAVCGMVTGVLAAHPGDCTFGLPCSEPLGFTALIVFVDAEQVPRDETGIEGWNYAGASRSAVQLYGQACAAVQSSNAPVDVDFLCELP